jgi:hypothetical protein
MLHTRCGRCKASECRLAGQLQLELTCCVFVDAMYQRVHCLKQHLRAGRKRFLITSLSMAQQPGSTLIVSRQHRMTTPIWLNSSNHKTSNNRFSTPLFFPNGTYHCRVEWQNARPLLPPSRLPQVPELLEVPLKGTAEVPMLSLLNS